jgi:hypothetical protein
MRRSGRKMEGHGQAGIFQHRLIYGNPKTEKLDTFSNAGGHIIFDILEIQFLLFDR